MLLEIINVDIILIKYSVKDFSILKVTDIDVGWLNRLSVNIGE